MINYLHSRLFRPEKSWDPVPREHAAAYATDQWKLGAREDLLDELSRWTGGLEGKTVLDLGGGPGHYSVAFAKRGAKVTWFDVSENYRNIAQERAREAGVEVRFVLGYLDEAPQQLGEKFDLVFNCICWFYGRGDHSFARVLFSLVRAGGVGYIDTTHSRWRREELPRGALTRSWLNDRFAWKIGHPAPPRGRLARLFLAKDVDKLLVDYSSPHNDRILFRRKSEIP